MHANKHEFGSAIIPLSAIKGAERLRALPRRLKRFNNYSTAP
jgi:hypothetical protein